MIKQSAPVGLLDSGMGGLSVLMTASRMLPNERYIYYGDTANAPYGEKNEDDVRTLVSDATDILLSRGVKALVLACNTATGVAAAMLREKLSIPVIGMEPALKPAASKRKNGKILVMATPITLHTEKYAKLYAAYGENAISLPCPGLMEFVERGDTDSPALRAHLRFLLASCSDMTIDAVVLGCTHYVFLRDAIATFFGEQTCILDGNEGTVRQLERKLLENGLRSLSPERGGIELLSSGGEEVIERMQALLNAAY